MGSGWTQLANELIGVSPFLVYAQGQARLKVQAVGTASVAGRQIFYNRSTSTVQLAGAATMIDAAWADIGWLEDFGDKARSRRSGRG